MGRSGSFYAMGVAVALWRADAGAFSPMDWSGNVSNDWFDTANWIGGVLPGDTIDVYINATGAHGWPQFDGSASIYTLRLGAIAGASLDILDHSTLTAHSTLLGGPMRLRATITACCGFPVKTRHWSPTFSKSAIAGQAVLK